MDELHSGEASLMVNFTLEEIDNLKASANILRNIGEIQFIRNWRPGVFILAGQCVDSLILDTEYVTDLALIKPTYICGENFTLADNFQFAKVLSSIFDTIDEVSTLRCPFHSVVYHTSTYEIKNKSTQQIDCEVFYMKNTSIDAIMNCIGGPFFYKNELFVSPARLDYIRDKYKILKGNM